MVSSHNLHLLGTVLSPVFPFVLLHLCDSWRHFLWGSQWHGFPFTKKKSFSYRNTVHRLLFTSAKTWSSGRIASFLFLRIHSHWTLGPWTPVHRVANTSSAWWLTFVYCFSFRWKPKTFSRCRHIPVDFKQASR